NDILSALVANALRADLVIILSDVDGLFTKNPQDPSAELIETVECVTCELKEAINGKSRFGRGGIQSKVKAAEIATTCGIPVVIANSRRANVITDILTGKQIGTYFKAQPRLPAVKSWIAYGAAVKGRIIVNAGAKKAILDGGSLLPVGITDVVGIFSAGDVVGVVGEDGVEFAKGNPNYDSGELQNIKGLQASQVKKQLGTKKPKEVIERRNIHLIEETKK
ncbi:MAG TPA: glutamate 5-kinase, partial [Saprospiraceae bacterium]|nr:glutamate 5-kinase [Saprospiraceae bacterium]